MNQHANILKELMPILAFFSFWLGACIASFLNVVIWRAPNIPILSWLALRGRCANCGASISPRYIFVEALGGCLFLAAFLWLWLPTVPLWFAVMHVVVMWIWIALMIAGAFIDFDHQLLPDFTTVGGMILGIAESLVATSFNFVYGDGVQASTWLKFTPLFWSLGGLVFGFGLLWLVRWIGSKAFKREAMGMGDVFLMGAVGALFGPVAVLVTLISPPLQLLNYLTT